MLIEDLFQKIAIDQPSVIFLTGKTSTGKTTFSHKMRDEFGYNIIELDDIVQRVITMGNLTDPSDVFINIYRGGSQKDWTTSFISIAQETILHAGDKIIVEGALANNETIAQVFNNVNGFSFVYFHPENKEKYIGMLTKRFLNGIDTNTTGLPKLFWSMVEEDALNEYLITHVLNASLQDSIQQFAEVSIVESKDRVRYFRESFPDIVVVSV